MFIPFSVTGCSLELLKTGEQGIVSFCKSQDETILKKLISIGITRGTVVTLEQRLHSLIIKVEDKSLTIDMKTIRAIYVRIIDN